MTCQGCAAHAVSHDEPSPKPKPRTPGLSERSVHLVVLSRRSATLGIVVDPITTGALAKAADRAVEELSPAAQKFAEGVVGAPSAEVGAALADRIRFRRWKTNVKLLEKAAKFAEERGIDPEAVPVKTLFPLLEKGSLEDPEDEDMIDRWANLLTSSADPNGEVPPSFPEILSQLTSFEARLLNTLYDRATDLPREEWWARGIVFSSVVSDDPNVSQRAQAAIENLYRLGIAAPPTTGTTTGRGGKVENRFAGSHTTPLTCLTELGYAFVSACRPPESIKAPPASAPDDAGTP